MGLTLNARILTASTLVLVLSAAPLRVSATKPDAAEPAEHGTRRAIIIGIDKYRFATAAELATARPQLIVEHMLLPGEEPPERDWHPLEGAVNDMRAMRELLLHRYGFSPENIVSLEDEAATRQGILDALEKTFIEGARDGDTLLFFFSGHGSQMRNSRSMTKGDKIDETIVPWDANAGYFDIRDKELARIFNQALAGHHVTLTAIFDSCHSGSITRGLINPKAKSEPEDKRDAGDAYNGGSPEARGALILSAAQYDEEALEAPDTSVSPNAMRGAFSMSLMHVIQYADPATPAVEIFRAARSRLHTLGSAYSQEPVIGGSAERLRRGLLGDSPGAQPQLTVHITDIDAETGTVAVDAGSLIGLSQGAVFRSVSGSPVEITVSQVDGFSGARATVTRGDALTLHLNDAFRMSTWAFPSEAPLTAWISPASLSRQKLAGLARVLAPLQRAAFHWVSDPSREVPTHTVEWTGTQWQLRGPGGLVDVTGVDRMPDSARIRAQLKGEDRLLVLLPLPSEWSSALRSLPGSVVATAKPETASYWLTGTLHGTRIAYAWTQPAAATAVPSTLTMPARTSWVAPESESSVHVMLEYLRTLSQVAAFLKLPESNSADPFPYHLVLRREGSAEDISGTDMQASNVVRDEDQKTLKTAQVTGGDIYDLVLKADKSSVGEAGTLDRWVYVFGVDSTAHREPFFIFGDQRARFPWGEPPIASDPSKKVCTASTYPRDAPLDEVCVGTLLVCPAYGADTYFVLSTDSPIADLTPFYGEGVATGDGDHARGIGNPLVTLLQSGLSGTSRGAVPEKFSIERLTVLSSGSSEIRECRQDLSHQ